MALEFFADPVGITTGARTPLNVTTNALLLGVDENAAVVGTVVEFVNTTSSQTLLGSCVYVPPVAEVVTLLNVADTGFRLEILVLLLISDHSGLSLRCISESIPAAESVYQIHYR